MTNYPNSRKANVVVQDLENEVLIYDLTINKAYCLNQTSAMVWQLSDGQTSVHEISERMSSKLKISVNEDIVLFALDCLQKENLLEVNELPNYFAELSRRELVKKIGLTSMVMLPVVASIVAPISVNAQSCIQLNNTCTPGPSNGGCCPMSLCAGAGVSTCSCSCSSPGQCLTQTSCPSTVNCNPSGVCAP